MRRINPKLLAVALSCVAVIAVVAQDKSKQITGINFADAYQRRLAAIGYQVNLIETQNKADEIESWKELLEPTFRLKLRYDRASRRVYRDTKHGNKLVLFAFALPADFRNVFPEFDQFKMSGILRSKALIYYHAVGNREVFAVLLSEQKPIHRDSELIESLSAALSEK